MYDPQLTFFNSLKGRWEKVKYELTKKDPFLDRQVRKIPVRQLGIKKIVIIRKGEV
jgi:hypothetical protein